MVRISSIVFLVFWVLVSCGDGTDDDKMADAGATLKQDRESLWIIRGRAAVRVKLKDPDSAVFKDVFFHRGQDGIPISCGYVNSRNSFGGMSGFQRFISAGKSELTFLEEQMADDFSGVWRRFCQ